MSVFGFRDRNTAETLRDFTKQLPLDDALAEREHQRILNHSLIAHHGGKMYWGLVTQTITKATYTTAMDRDVQVPKKKLILGKGKVAIHIRDKRSPINPDQTVPRRSNLSNLGPGGYAPKLVEITAYNISVSEEFPATTTPDEIDNTDQDPVIIVEDAFGDFYVLPSAGDGTIILATTETSVTSGTATFTANVLKILFGSEPNFAASQPVTFNNTFNQDYTAGQKLIGIKNVAEDRYETTKEGDTIESPVINYELVETMTKSTIAALAKPVLLDGTMDAGAVSFYVLDPMQQFMGRAAWTDAQAVHKGYRGYALKVTDDYQSTGKPAYRIISQEGPMLLITVTLAEDLASPTTTVLPYGSDAQLEYGNPFRGRYPEVSSASGAFEVSDPNNVAADAKNGDVWHVIYSEVDAGYVFFLPANPATIYSRIRGKPAAGSKTSGVLRTDTTIILDNVEVLIGKSPVAAPADQITVFIPPNARMNIPANTDDWIYAQYNPEVGVDETDRWDSGDEANHYWVMRGHVGWHDVEPRVLVNHGNLIANMEWLSPAAFLKKLGGYIHGNNQSILHDGSSDPIWRDDGTC